MNSIKQYCGVIFIVAVLALTACGEIKVKGDIDSDLGLLAEAYQINLRAMGEGLAYDELKELSEKL